MVIYHEVKHCAAVIVEEVDVVDDGETITVAATESKLECQGSSLAQLLAGMEKVAGDVAYVHLTRYSRSMFMD